MLTLITLLIPAFFAWLALTSFLEKEFQAFWISLGLAVAATLFFGLALPFAPALVQNAVMTLLTGLALVSVLPFFPKGPPPRQTALASQYDERDTMFARNHLKHYPDLMAAYYEMRPENRSRDSQIHAKPDFGSPNQTFHDPLTTPFYLAAFDYLEKTIPLSDGPVVSPPKPLDPEALAETIKDLVRFYGGVDTGILPLAPHHFYSHKGRHSQGWGRQTDQTFATAIVIVVPMRVTMIKQAPSASVIQESAQKYVEAAKISNILAGYLRSLGYGARAHNDANYEVLCVPLAVAAGIGELGRMGIFMHRTLGPCVRLAVVTTDLELPATAQQPSLHMDHFCQICKKCADNCPAGAITKGEEPVSRGFRHWSIDQEKCFSFWKTIGSDCGLCISVCPYTKPDTLLHRLVRFYISRNALNQRIALLMDDLLYKRKKPIARTNPARILIP